METIVVINREVIYDLISAFENFLVNQGLTKANFPHAERDETDEDEALIWGPLCDELEESIKDVLRSVNIVAPDEFGDINILDINDHMLMESLGITPGPWKIVMRERVELDPIVSIKATDIFSDFTICEMVNDGNGTNTRLIAKAPEMYAALRNLEQWTKDCLPSTSKQITELFKDINNE